MDTIPSKRKRLIKNDSDAEEEEEEELLSSQLSTSDRILPTAGATSKEPTPFKEPTPLSATPAPSSQPALMDTSTKKKTPRLVMKKMVLNNFKSYAGRQVIGPFHKSFSAIVGPNGSGKSNVIDALLFVFGYRANKMRQGKLSELIHNSAKHPDCKQCSVEIHFQEIIDGDTPKDFTIVPNSTLVVARQASRNNSSKYSINNKTSSFTEVTTLLKARGIDLDHKRFLILQGEVESIALMKAKAKDGSDDGLLEYLEDIIGTSKYKEPIEQANARLEVLNEERSEKLSRVKYVSREMDGMEEKKAEAEEYLQNENELVKKKNELYQIYSSEANENIGVANQAIEELKIKLDEELKKFESLEKEKSDMNTAYQDTVQEYKSIEAQHNNLIQKQSKYEKEQVQVRERKNHLITKQEKGKATLEADRKSRADAQQSIEKNAKELEQHKEELAKVEQQLKEEEKKLDTINRELKGKTDGYMAEINEYKQKLAPWTEKINEKQKAIDVKKSESEILAEKISSGEKAVENAKLQVAKLTESIKYKQKEAKNLPSEIKEAKIELRELELYLQDLGKNEADKRAEMNNARQKADEARASMQQSQSRGKVLDSILRMRDTGRVEGIYDRLGSLGVIDDRYDVAISTACPALDNIVVETVEAGQACIEYLRKNNLGRAVFTVLDQLRHQNMKEIETPENVPRLFDLVEPKDERFRAAFYSVLQDTLVAENMQQANRIAYGQKRWRVVTMDGKLIEKSGAMTGGGNRQLRGAMSSVFKDDGVSAEVVMELERERDNLERDYRIAADEKRASENALRRKSEHLPKLEMNHEKLQMDISSLESQLEDEEQRLVELRDQVAPSPADVRQQELIESEIVQLQEDLIELKEKTVEIDEAIAALQNDIMEAGGMDLRIQTICVNDMRKKIDNLNNKITKNMVAKTKAEKDVSKLEASIAKFERESEKFEHNLKDLEDELESCAKTLEEIVEQVKQTTQAMEEKKIEMERVKKELDDKHEAINKLRQSEVEINAKLDDYKRTLLDNRKKADHWEGQRDRLELQRIDDELDEDLKLELFHGEQLEELIQSKQAIKMEIAEIETFVQNAKPNLSVLEEYRRRRGEYNERKGDLDSVTAKRDEVKAEVETLRKKRLDEFMSGFNVISQKLKEMYQMITMGGNAELELVDSLDPFSEGIVFSVMPPKKSWKNISNLSGGEKTLSSLALVFALHHFKPTPLYVMDEIDAALDFRNVSIVANYIADRTKDAQFVIISLRNNMFELADRLVGIYKTSHCTKSIAINPNMIATLTSIPTQANSSSTRKSSTPQTPLPTNGLTHNASQMSANASSSAAADTEKSQDKSNADQPSSQVSLA
ncbi:Structural maintenance of chromosomes protein 4 [Mucor circinelloides]